MSKYKRAFPWIALGAGLVALICFAVVSTFVGQARTADEVTRVEVETALQAVLEIQPAVLEDGSFRQALEEFGSSPYVVYIWLIAPDGEIVFSTSGFAKTGNVEDHATEETLRVLDSLDAESLPNDTRVSILAASAIMSEGEHNDVFRQMLRPVSSESGEIIGWVGVSYDANTSLTETDGVYIAVLLLWVVGTGSYWLMLPAWVWVDAKERGEKAGVWVLFVLLGNLVALLAYLLTRPQERE